MAYRELPPPPDLAPYVACLWVRTGPGGHVLPDGCADIVWTGAGLVVAGPATGALRPAVVPGVPKLGLRFRVGAAGASLGLPAQELLDRDVPLAELWRTGAAAEDAVARAPTAPAGLEALAQAVRERLPSAEPVDPLVRAAAVRAARAGSRVSELSARLGISERHLRRRFAAAVGYGPKTLAGILRFQRFLALAQREPAGRGGLARLALEAGYADQAHLTRECRRLAGLPPTALLAASAGPAGERALALPTPA